MGASISSTQKIMMPVVAVNVKVVVKVAVTVAVTVAMVAAVQITNHWRHFM